MIKRGLDMIRSFMVATLLLITTGSWAVAEQTTGNPKEGKVLYERHCLRCHGEKLDGRGPDAKVLTVPPADLSSLSSRMKSDFELLVTIAHGVLFTPMHGFRETLSEDNIRDVLAYIRMEAPFKPLAMWSSSNAREGVVHTDAADHGKNGDPVE